MRNEIKAFSLAFLLLFSPSCEKKPEFQLQKQPSHILYETLLGNAPQGTNKYILNLTNNGTKIVYHVLATKMEDGSELICIDFGNPKQAMVSYRDIRADGKLDQYFLLRPKQTNVYANGNYDVRYEETEQLVTYQDMKDYAVKSALVLGLMKKENGKR